MNEDDQIRENLLAIENAKRVHATLMENAKEEGSKQEKIEITKNMLKEKIEINLISKITGLTKEEIENLE